MQEFLIELRPVRATFGEDASDAEQAIVGDHFAHLAQAHEAGVLVLAGRTLDSPPLGLVVIQAETLDDAQAFAQADPAVRNKVFSAEVRPYRIALLAGRSLG